MVNIVEREEIEQTKRNIIFACASVQIGFSNITKCTLHEDFMEAKHLAADLKYEMEIIAKEIKSLSDDFQRRREEYESQNKKDGE
jgi:hypothetical protein